MPDSFMTPWAITHQVRLSRKEYWNGVPFSSPGGLPTPEIEPASPAMAGGFFTTEPPGKPSKAKESLRRTIKEGRR